MFTLIVTVLAAMVVLGFLFRIADSTTYSTATSRALNGPETLRSSAHSGAIR